MPHVLVKLVPGKSEEQKIQLTRQIVASVTTVLNYPEDAVSVAFEEVPAQDWKQSVYLPDIQARSATLYKQPGYTPE